MGKLAKKIRERKELKTQDWIAILETIKQKLIKKEATA